MVSLNEFKARMEQYFRFTQAELLGLIIAILVTGFIFSFRSWGVEKFELFYGLKNFLWITLAACLAFLGHLIPQKIYALNSGYQAEFRPWWAGMVIALVLCFVTQGYLTLVLAGGVWLIFIVRQRLGEFRYGYRQEDQAVTGFWGILGTLIAAGLFKAGNFLWPEVLFFEKGVWIGLVLAICSVLPLPWLTGLNLFYASRGIYFISIILVLVMTLLFSLPGTGGGWGLLVAAIIGAIAGGYYFLAMCSEKY